MVRHVVVFALLLCGAGRAPAIDLPYWVGEVATTAPDENGIGFITLSGEWGDSCAPDAISHEFVWDTIQLVVEHPGINVTCLTVITPWLLTESFGPLPPGSYDIFATLYAVDPHGLEMREKVSGPDLLVERYVVPEPSALYLSVIGSLAFLSCPLRRRATA